MEEMILPSDSIKNRIYEIRGVKVMLDRDLAQMYEVETFNLNKAVKRNIERFPPDFMFQLTKEEWELLMFQIGTSKAKFFTESDRTTRRGGTQPSEPIPPVGYQATLDRDNNKKE